MTAAWSRLPSKSNSKILGSFTRSGLKLEPPHTQQKATNIPFLVSSHFWTSKDFKGILAKEKKTWTVAWWSKVLFSDESKNLYFIWKSMSHNSRGKVKRHEIRVALKPVWSFLLVIIGSAISFVSVGPVFWSSPQLMYSSVRRFLEHFRLLYFDKLYGDVHSLFQQDFAQCVRSTSNHFAGHSITVLNWSANLPNLNLSIYC